MTVNRYNRIEGRELAIETLIEPRLEKRSNFELFKSAICHRLKELGDMEFIIELLEEDSIRKYHKKKWYPESLYLLAMLGYISRENNIPLCTQYDDMRHLKLKSPLLPAGVLVAAKIAKSDASLQQSIDEAIPEFIRFNIVEKDVRNVV